MPVNPWDRYSEMARLIANALDACAVPYAIGGAIAYGYHSEPRATTDVDINIFLSNDGAEGVLACLSKRWAFDSEAALVTIQRTDQVRVQLDGVFVDLFFANFDFHVSCWERARLVPFTDRMVHVLSAEDLVVWKTLFNRGKDWVDIRQVLLTQGERFDAGYALRWLDEILGPDDPARIRLADEIAQARRDFPG